MNKKIFNCLRKANLKIQPQKCQFLRKETKFLGHIITNNGVKPNPDKIQPILKYNIPKTPTQVRRFLGMVGFYRKFIKDFAKVAKPLTSALKKGSKIDSKNPSYIHSFESLKALIASHPILQYPDFTKQFTVTTDASQYAIGAVLSQGGRPISFASRTLNEHELNYSVIQKELLAIVWAVKYFRPYLYGVHFLIETDHRPLQFLKNIKEHNSLLQRWRTRLGEYQFDIKYVKGKTNYVADALSREVYNIESLSPTHNSSGASTAATMHSAQEDSSNLIEITYKPLNVFKTQLILKIGPQTRNITKVNNKTIITLSYPEYTEQICKDILLNEIPQTKFVGLLMEALEEFVIFQDCYNEIKPNFKIIRSTKNLPNFSEADAREEILQEHIRLNHRGINNVIRELFSKFYIKNFKRLVTKVVNNCETCKASKYERTPLKIPFKITKTPTKPNQIFHLDIWYPTKGKYYVSCIDKFSKFATLTEIPNRNWISIKNALANIFISMGVPNLIITDHEKAMQTENIKQFLDQHNVGLHLGTPDNKSSNSDVERLHSTLNEHIRTIKNKPASEKQFDDPILEAIFTYNKTIHSTTGRRPIELHREDNGVVINEVFKKMTNLKMNKILKLNEHRKDEPADFEYQRNHKRFKLDNIYKKVRPTNITASHAHVGNKRYYKSRFRKLKQD